MIEIIEIAVLLAAIYGLAWRERHRGRIQAIVKLEEHVSTLIEANAERANQACQMTDNQQMFLALSIASADDTLKRVLSVLEMEKNG